ncbi:MAG: hypothetical protein JNL38_04685 [Myxococcales bacterium]|jgi:hypothetical protein|nr:hypothetical protein [Myxococcales bacterium]
MHHTRFFRLGLAFAALSVGGCFAVTDLGRFERKQPTNPNFYDIEFTVNGMTSHVAEMFELRILDENGVVQTRVLGQPLGGPTAHFTIPAAVDKRQRGTKLAFFADHNLSKQFDLAPAPGDHSWTLALDGFKPDPLDDVIRVSFDHTTIFQTLDAPKDVGVTALVRVVNAGAIKGRRFQARIADASSRHVVGIYRVPEVKDPTFEAKVPGVIDSAQGTRYQVEITLDDGNGGGLQGFRLFGDSGANGSGLDVTFDPGAAPRADGILPPSEPPL